MRHVDVDAPGKDQLLADACALGLMKYLAMPKPQLVEVLRRGRRARTQG